MAKRELSFWERMRYNYRLVVMNHETFEERGSYRISPLSGLIIFGLLFSLLSALIWCLVAYSPIRQFIPGYEGSENYELKMQELNETVGVLEEQLAANESRMKGLVLYLRGEAETAEDFKTPEDIAAEEIEIIEPIKEDSLLRREVAMEDVGIEAKELNRTVNFTSERTPEQLYLIPPVNGNPSKGYEPDSRHYGIDFTAPKNTPIRVAMDGYVFFSDWTMETGNVIGVQHANNVLTFYKHNSELLKEVGEYVKAGEAIAIIGNTGVKTDGPHLHFELWINGHHVNPADYFTFTAGES